jgi:hypothetical protein
MIMMNFAQRSKSVNFFQTTKFSNTDINFSNILLMFVQIFRSYFSEEIFYHLILNSSVYRYVYVQKHKLINSNQKKKKKTESKQKQKYIHNIQG